MAIYTVLYKLITETHLGKYCSYLLFGGKIFLLSIQKEKVLKKILRILMILRIL